MVFDALPFSNGKDQTRGWPVGALLLWLGSELIQLEL